MRAVSPWFQKLVGLQAPLVSSCVLMWHKSSVCSFISEHAAGFVTSDQPRPLEFYKCLSVFFFLRKKLISVCSIADLWKRYLRAPPFMKTLDKTLEIVSSLSSLRSDAWEAMLWLDKLKYKIIDLWAAAELLRIISHYIFGIE